MQFSFSCNGIMRNCTDVDKGKEKLVMKKMRKGTAVLLLLLPLCVPAVDVSADVGNGLAEYTVAPASETIM